MLTGKTILVGVSGGIAAYKAVQLVSDLRKLGAQVHVLMTKNATQLVAPLTFETMSGNRVSVDTFDRNFEWNVQHVSLAQKADAFIVAPATANVIAKFAAGLADDMLTTTFLAAECPKLVAPAMNTAMYENSATQRNLKALRMLGMDVIDPDAGFLACSDSGRGRLPDTGVLTDHLLAAITPKDLTGCKVVVTAGPTREPIDPVRYITNHSTGKMGYQTAQAAARRGARVTLISGPVSLPCPYGVKRVMVESAAQMYEAVMTAAREAHIIVKSAAVADYTPAVTADHKVKKSDGDLSLALTRTRDILAALGQNKRPGQVIVGFSMETDDLIANSTAKLAKKKADMIVANSLREEGAGFGGDTNVATLITAQGAQRLEKMTKYELGNLILTRAAALLK